MIKLLQSRAVIAILALVIGVVLGNLSRIKPTESSPKEGEIKIVKEYVDSIVYVPKPFPVTKLKIVEVPVPYYVDTTRARLRDKKKYGDTVLVDTGIAILYDATVSGTLDSLKLGYIDTRPEKVIYKTQETTVIKEPSGIYVGAQVGPQTISPQIKYLKGKNLYGVGYNVVDKGVTIEYSYRISK